MLICFISNQSNTLILQRNIPHTPFKQRWMCSLIKKEEMTFKLPLNLYFLVVRKSLTWTILFPKHLLKIEEIHWSEENFHLCSKFPIHQWPLSIYTIHANHLYHSSNIITDCTTYNYTEHVNLAILRLQNLYSKYCDDIIYQR